MTAMPHLQGFCPPNCFGCKVASISFSATAMPTRSNVGETVKYEKTRQKDIAAYRRLRKEKVDGVNLRPKSTVGAAALEARASSVWEVNTGQNLGGNEKLGRRFDEVQKAATKGELA